MATIDLFTVKCPVPFFVVLQYSSLQNAYYNVSPTTITLYTDSNAWSTGSWLYTDLAKTVNANASWYTYGGERRNSSAEMQINDYPMPPTYYTLLGAPDTSIPPPPYGYRAMGQDYCDSGFQVYAYHDGSGGYYYDYSSDPCY